MCLIKGCFSQETQKADDISKALTILNEITSNQDPCPEAFAQLGYLYEYGNFEDDPDGVFKVNVDIKTAIKCNEKARQLNCPRGSNNLGLLYF